MHRDPGQSAQRRSSASAGPATEDHGRVVTTNVEAAAFYRIAQQAADLSERETALRQATRIDPGFGLAIADLDALAQTPPRIISCRPMSWERHHIEIVRTAAAGDHSKAAGLLREHVATVGCDPIALSIVASLRRQAGYRGGLEDLIRRLPGCHPLSHPS